MARKIISIVLILVGIGLIATPIVGKEIVKYQQKKIYDEYMRILEEQLSAQAKDMLNPDNTSENENNDDNNDNAGQYYQDDTDSINIMNDRFDAAVTERDLAEKAKKKQAEIWSKLKVIGRIMIPKINVNLLTLEGSTDNDLIYGAGHVLDTAYPGETGNCAIAGHRGYSFGTYFYRLNELKAGDVITVSYFGTDYNYIVEESFLVLPTDVYVLRQPKYKKMLTLITCDPPVIGSHRLIVTARLEGDVDTKPAPATDSNTDNTAPDNNNSNNNEGSNSNTNDTTDKNNGN